MNNRYELMVKRGKQIVEDIRELDKKVYAYQMDIAKMAVAVCNISHGGISTNKYTIKDYAEDIGMGYKTVQNWVSVYRNVALKLETKVTTANQWKNATTTNNLLKVERSLKNEAAEKKGTLHAYKQGIPKQKVNSLFKSVSNGTADTMKSIVRCVQSAKHIKFKLEEINLNMINDLELTSLMETLDYASDLINNHLTDKSKRAV